MPLTCRFQFTPPRRGRRPTVASFADVIDFNSRPREGGDHIGQQSRTDQFAISIHAPAKGATGFQSSRITIQKISIHAPAKGATCAVSLSIFALEFQFTPPRRGRPFSSPHCRRPLRFQFTPPRRGRHLPLWWPWQSPHYFNSRPREGGDRYVGQNSPQCWNFNSRPREGGDSGRRQRKHPQLFQFTPPRRGRRQKYNEYKRKRMISIHAPAKGATALTPVSSTASRNFNSRPREGGDSIIHHSTIKSASFYSAI